MEIREMKNRFVFDDFVAKSPTCHYMKTSMWGEFEKITSGRSYRMLGFYENEALLGTAMALFHKGVFSYMYVPKGPCIDYNDENLAKEAFCLLKEYALKENVVFLRVDPNVLRLERDIKGNPVENGENHEALTALLQEEGYTHKGYNYAYDGSWTNRYTMIIDACMPIEKVFKGFSKNRKWNIRHNEKLGFSTRQGTQFDIPLLLELQKELSEIKGFKPHSHQYFETLMDCFGSHAHMYVVDVSMPHAIEHVQAQKEKAKTDEERNNYQATINELQGFQSNFGNEISPAVGLFITFGNTCWTVYYYFRKAFRRYSPIDTMLYDSLRELKEKGIEWMDLCGFGGTSSKDDPEYNLYYYKHTFGPKFIEHIGQFDYVAKPKAMKAYLLESKVVNRLKREYHLRIYTKKNKKEEN